MPCSMWRSSAASITMTLKGYMKRILDCLIGIALALSVLILYSCVASNDRAAYCITHYCGD